MSEITTVPYGELEGLPCIKVVVPTHTSVNYLIELLTRSWKPGTRVLWIDDASWGELDFDDCVVRLLSDPVSEGVELWSYRGVEEPTWSTAPIWNVVDCSDLFSKPQTRQSLVDDIQHIPYIPRPTELVVTDPHIESCLPSLLDTVSTHLDPEAGSYIYLNADYNDEYYDQVLSSASNASTRWGIRHGR